MRKPQRPIPRPLLMPRHTVAFAMALALLAAGCSVDFSIGADAARDASTVDASQIIVGDCYDDPLGETDEWVEVEDVNLVRCDEPHDLEAFHSFDLPAGAYPSDEALDAAVDEACVGAFEGFVGQTYEDSGLDLAFLTPSEEAWANGDRKVICSLYAMDLSKLRGSMEGSGR
jgi:hypothetical protein